MDNKNLNNDEIDLKEIFIVLWRKKFLIAFCTTLSAIISIFYAISLPNIYTSSALLAPTSTEDNLSSKLSNYQSLAGLAGIGLPNQGGSKAEEALERIKSYDFFVEQFLPYIKFEDLVASKKWDQVSNQIIYDDNIFDINNKKWIRKAPYPQLAKPSDQEAYLKYIEILSVSQDKLTSFVTIDIEHVSPYVAKDWLNLIIKNINNLMRDIDKNLASESVDFLKNSANNTNLSEIKTAISNLIESQMKVLTLTESKDDYIFKPISSPNAPEIKTRPSRAQICILGSILGIIFGALISIILNYINQNRK